MVQIKPGKAALAAIEGDSMPASDLSGLDGGGTDLTEGEEDPIIEKKVDAMVEVVDEHEPEITVEAEGAAPVAALKDILTKFKESNKANIFAGMLADMFEKERPQASGEDFMGFLKEMNAMTSDEKVKEYSCLPELLQQGLGTGREEND